jgi:ubiquinone/menaquinone biosynthesis C-methylase UbiE
MHLKNWAISIVIKRMLFGPKARKIIPWRERYAKILDKDFNAEEYVLNKRQKWNRLVDTVLKYTPKNGKILEAGCGTSALSIWFSKKKYNTSALDADKKVLEIASTLNKKSCTAVRYKAGSLLNIPYPDKCFDTVFSHGTLEHFNKKQLQKAVNEGLRVADTYIFGVPTIFDVSNCLRGDEYLATYLRWKSIIKKSDGYIYDSYASFPFHPRMEKLNKFFGSKLAWISPTIVFVIKPKK